MIERDFPGRPVVKTLAAKIEGAGSSPGRGIKTPHAAWHSQKMKKQQKQQQNIYIGNKLGRNSNICDFLNILNKNFLKRRRVGRSFTTALQFHRSPVGPRKIKKKKKNHTSSLTDDFSERQSEDNTLRKFAWEHKFLPSSPPPASMSPFNFNLSSGSSAAS